MEGKGRKKNKGFDVPLVIGVIGHCPIEQLLVLKQFFKDLPGFDLIFFRTSTGKLWITGEEDSRNVEHSGRNEHFD